MSFLSNLLHLKNHRFLRWILVVSTATIVLVPLSAHLAVYPMFEKLIIENSETEAIRAAHFLAVYMDLRKKDITNVSLPANLDENAQEAVKNLELAKFKIFSPKGLTIYSTDAADIGTVNTHDYFRERVMQGEPYSKVVQKTKPTLEGQTYDIDVVETYVPIMNVDGAFSGAFEIYYEVTERLQRMETLINYVTATTIAAALTLLAIILWLLSRAGHASKQQDQMQSRLRELNHQKQMILDTVGEGIFGVDTQGKLSFVNPAALNMMAWPEKQLLNEFHHSLVHHTKPDGTPNPPEDCPIQRSFQSRTVVRSEYEMFWRKDGSGFPVDMTAAPLLENGVVTGAVVVFHDITERLESERALQEANLLLDKQARVDSLTEISNRRAFDELWESAWRTHKRTKEPLSLLLMDVDFFKRFNDRYGHQAGDNCLKAVARALSESMYRPDDSLARYGGEEFIAILSNTDAKGAQLVAARFLLAVEGLGIPHDSSDASGSVTISIGIANVVYGNQSDPSEVIRNADQALYRAKETGRNRQELFLRTR